MKCDICGCEGAQPRTQCQPITKGPMAGGVLYIDWNVCFKDECLKEVRN